MTTVFPSLINDDSASILTRGYGFGARIWSRATRGARSVPMRLLGDKTLLVRGADAVALFYDEDRIARHGAMPGLVQATLHHPTSAAPTTRHDLASVQRTGRSVARVGSAGISCLEIPAKALIRRDLLRFIPAACHVHLRTGDTFLIKL